MGQFPRYTLPLTTLGGVLLALLQSQGHRLAREDARACVARLRPALRVYGRDHIPPGGPVLLTINHYARPGFHAWWLVLAVSAVVRSNGPHPAPGASCYTWPGSASALCRSDATSQRGHLMIEGFGRNTLLDKKTPWFYNVLDVTW